MMANTAPYYHGMQPPTKYKSDASMSNGQNISSKSDKLALKIKDEPPDWTLNNSNMANPYCAGGGMGPFMSMHHGMYPGPHMGMMTAFPGQLAMNGMTPHPLPGLPPPLTHPPHGGAPPSRSPQSTSNIPMIKQEIQNTGYQNCSQSSTSTNSSTTTTTSSAANKKSKKPVDKKPCTDIVKKEIKQETLTDSMPVKKKRDRFNGMTEEEVMKRTLPDHLCHNLDILIVGINPGLTAAYIGHHYAGPGNHMWKCLYLSGLIPEPMNAYDDYKLKEYGIGFTNIVERTSRGSVDLTKKEIKAGGDVLLEKIQKYKPKIVVFNGKGIYEIFCGHKNFYIGKQPDKIPGTDTFVYVMPSSSARCSQLPRAVDKVPFYVALKKLRDHVRGEIKELNEADVTFPDLELKVEPKKDKALKLKEEAAIANSKDKKKGLKRKSCENDSLDNLAMSAMNSAHHGMSQFVHPGSLGPPLGFPWQQHVGISGLQALSGPPGQQASLDGLFTSSHMLIKQEDLNELANYGITANTFAGQSYLTGCPAPKLPTVSHPAPWHSAACNNSSSQYGSHFNSAPAPSTNSLPSPTGYRTNGSNSSLSPHQLPNSNPSCRANGHCYSSPSYVPQQGPSNENNLSPNRGGPPHTPGPLSPSYPTGQHTPQAHQPYPYQYNSGPGQSMGFG
ncbi:hypothetical protein LSH36_18g09012 [Paralvinella palmiformis]|uniref:G/T mismatch-specific thymine DNA glycosylase n=1 Tax=Paralvinella palmiformis TaxID=53620 RepID=A0AAD9KCS4_9ANNE|nr:hypothetical protein LSH36_18g09012 [Paralvinella palmiformis]